MGIGIPLQGSIVVSTSHVGLASALGRVEDICEGCEGDGGGVWPDWAVPIETTRRKEKGEGSEPSSTSESGQRRAVG